MTPFNDSVVTAEVETEGNKVSTSFHLATKETAVRCWRDAVDASGVDDKVLAADARLSRGHYSKLASGGQGDLLGLAYRVGVKHPAIRADFFARLIEAESINPIHAAAEQLAQAALRYLRLSAMARARVPMAKASIADESRQAVNE